MFNRKTKFVIEVYILKSINDFGKASYSDDKELSRYIHESDFIPRQGDIILYNKIYFKIDKIVLDYQTKSLIILLSESKTDFKVQK
jgi:hypothetical protein